jgi:hypothetical protein
MSRISQFCILDQCALGIVHQVARLRDGTRDGSRDAAQQRDHRAITLRELSATTKTLRDNVRQNNTAGFAIAGLRADNKNMLFLRDVSGPAIETNSNRFRRFSGFRLRKIDQHVKNAILCTCRSCDPQHADRYLAAYEWRFNRRFDLARNVQRLARVALATNPVP